MNRLARGALLAPALALAGCATMIRDHMVHSYMGVPFDASETSPQVAALAQRSLTGDKQAQLDLGIAFEKGRGVARDPDKARALYRLAASESGGPVPVYVPGIGDSPGRVVRVGTGDPQPGLAAAKKRLENLGE
ncbi:MAG: hypothetical protein CMN72_02990 [Sphingomonas sp.]|nr:hypothetical protein [Sphingomonas sp.]